MHTYLGELVGRHEDSDHGPRRLLGRGDSGRVFDGVRGRALVGEVVGGIIIIERRLQHLAQSLVHLDAETLLFSGAEHRQTLAQGPIKSVWHVHTYNTRDVERPIDNKRQ